jgi:uncharacterized protein YjiK
MTIVNIESLTNLIYCGMITFGVRYLALVIVLGFIHNPASLAQVIPDMQYQSHVVIEEKEVNNETLGGFSGITFNPLTKEYVLVADKPPARFVHFTLDSEGSIGINWKSTSLLEPEPMQSSELEGIAYSKQADSYFVSDEQSQGTRIMKFDQATDFKRIVLPNNKPFLPLSAHNSGIEGLTITDNNQFLYYAFERPTDNCQESGLITIGKIDLKTSKVEAYPYQLHNVTDDILGTNGVSALLAWNDSTLLVMERAYIPNTGNIVRLYEVQVTGTGRNTNIISCGSDKPSNLASRLVYDFASEPAIKIDNAEGMCFNEDRTMLFIITDNNFSKKQETQLVRLSIME